MTPTPPALEFAFQIRADVAAPLQGAAGRLGTRVHIAITGGSVAGPLLNGRILPGGSDWLLARPDGASVVDAHYTLLADDGTPIYVHNRGLRVSSDAVLQRLKRGEPVAPHAFYFRSAPVFDAPAGPHGWLADHLFIADLRRDGAAVVIEVFVVR